MLLLVALLLLLCSFLQPCASNAVDMRDPRQHCGGYLSEDQYQELLELSDLSTFTVFTEAPARTRRIAEVFAEAGDRRGIFASMYVMITEESVNSTLRGEYEHPHWSALLVYQFASRYMGPLHQYLLGNNDQVDPKWMAYYDLADDCDSDPIRTLGTGVNTHLTYDLPLTNLEIGAGLEFEEDFMKFGDLLVLITKPSTDLLYEQQGVDAWPLFNAYFVGSFVDGMFGQLTMARLVFQHVRGTAWEDFTYIYNFPESFMADSLNRRWLKRQQILKAVAIFETVKAWII